MAKVTIARNLKKSSSFIDKNGNVVDRLFGSKFNKPEPKKVEEKK